MKSFFTSVILSFLFAIPLANAQQVPVMDFETVMNTYFDDESGLISFGDYRTIFATEEPFNAQVAVLNSAGEVLAYFPFFPELQPQQGVYAGVRVQGPADTTLTEAGEYFIKFAVDDVLVTQIPVRLVQTSTGDDPFNPVKTFAFEGYWSTFSYITMNTWDGQDFPSITYWVGGFDLEDGEDRANSLATLYRDGVAIAHSLRQTGIIQAGHYQSINSNLYHPHDISEEANARQFLLSDWTSQNGNYELQVTRYPDGELLRSFDFRVSDGQIENHPRSQLNYEPRVDYIAPRVMKNGTTSYEYVEAIWIEDRDLD